MSIINTLEQITKGFHSVTTFINFGFSFISTDYLAGKETAVSFQWTMLMGSLFTYITLFTLNLKYVITAFLNDWDVSNALWSLTYLTFVDELPDFLITTLPLFMNYKRIEALAI